MRRNLLFFYIFIFLVSFYLFLCSAAEACLPMSYWLVDGLTTQWLSFIAGFLFTAPLYFISALRPGAGTYLCYSYTFSSAVELSNDNYSILIIRYTTNRILVVLDRLLHVFLRPGSRFPLLQPQLLSVTHKCTTSFREYKPNAFHWCPSTATTFVFRISLFGSGNAALV